MTPRGILYVLACIVAVLLIVILWAHYITVN